MEIDNIMLGDWVVFHDSGYNSDGTVWKDDRICRITAIDGMCMRVRWEDIDGYSDESVYIPVTCFSPIPLTCEILERNVFNMNGVSNNLVLAENRNYCDDTYVWSQSVNEYESITISIYIEQDKEFVEINYPDGSLNIKCKFIHELQHALKLCKIKKNIEL